MLFCHNAITVFHFSIGYEAMLLILLFPVLFLQSSDLSLQAPDPFFPSAPVSTFADDNTHPVPDTAA